MRRVSDNFEEVVKEREVGV